MKKRTLTFYVSLMASFLIGAQAFAQVTVNMPFNNGPQTFTATAGACPAFNFFDNGGQFGVYSNNSGANSVVTFNPSVAGNKIRTTFTVFSTEASWDALYVYDGVNIAATKIASPNALPIGGSPFGTGGWWGTQAPNNVAGTTNVVQATGPNASGALTFAFSSDASVQLAGWEANIIEVPSASCVMTPSANVTVSTGTTGCEADVTVATPAFSPGGCQNTLTLRYRVNGGAPITIPPPVGANITLLSLPRGVNTITWELISVVCGQSIIISSANQTITVTDLTPPVLTCPPNVTLNLAPGECSTFYSYNVGVTDNCPFIVPAAPVQFPASFAAHGGGLAFVLSGNTLPGGLYFNLTNNGGVQAIITGFGVRFPNPAFGVVTVPRTLEIWSTPTTYAGKELTQAQWTNVGPATITANPPYFATGTGPIAQANFTQNVTLNPGETRGFYIYGPNWCPVFNYTFGIQPPITNGPFTQTAGSVSFNFFANLFATGAFNHPNIQVNYLTGGGGDIQQTAGLPSGAEFPIGTTQNCFSVFDASGNSATCCFNVTVNEFPNAIKTLICNDLVNISLDSSCTHTIGADQVLEGGPYRCYDNYIVQLDRVAPFGNGPWTPATLGPGDVGKSYAYRVVDPATNNTCWGMVVVEDKLPPVLVCRDITIPCDSIPAVNPAPAIVGYQIQSTGNINDPIGAPSGPTTRQYNFDFSYLPAGTPVQDVNVCCRLTGHTWLPDLDILVIAPDGTQADCFAVTGCFGQEFPIDCKWDDEGLGGVTACAQLDQDGGPLQCFVAPGNQNNTVLAAFDGKDASGVWRIRINDAIAPDDGVIEFLCLEILVNVPGIAVTDGCGPVTLTFQDTEVNTNCASGFTKIIRRKFTATDQSGNTTTCIQNINFARPNLADVVVPPNYDDLQAPAFNCTGVYPTPDYIQSIGLQGYPTVNGFPVSCGLSIVYDDKVIGVCDGTYKIRREWLILDWCTGGEIKHVQLLKVKDDVPPAFNCPADLTVTTDPFNCCATVDLPDMIVSDVCSRINKINAMIIGISPVAPFDTIGMFTVGGSLTSFPGNNLWTPDTLAAFGTTPCLPPGRHTVIYMVEDDCGNQRTCSFRLTVADYTPPVAACDEFTVVGIGVDDPFDCYLPSADGCQFAGVTWVKATTFDDGSYDNCNNVKFTIQRMSPYSECINNLNAINGRPECDPLIDPFPDPITEFERATGTWFDPNYPFPFGKDSIKFYCCEVGTTQMIVLRVYQVDLNGFPIAGPDGSPVFNECMIEVEVQDKIKPVCQAPANTTVSCANFDVSLWAYGNATVFDNCCLDTASSYLGQKGLTHSIDYSRFDSLCNRGTITRRWTARDCYGQTSQCSQRIIVDYDQNYFVRFPDDALVTFCDSSGVYGVPTFFGEDCELLGVSFSDEVFTVVPDACYKIERTWRIINWCTYDVNAGCIDVPNPEPNATVNAAANRPGPIVSPAGTPMPWAPTIINIKPGQAPTNYSTFWQKNANCYTYKQIIKIIDPIDPVVANCPASPLAVDDITDNDANFYNAMAWWDPITASHDLCEAPADLQIEATDVCSKADLKFSYLLFLDLDQNGTMETVISSNNPPNYNTINVGNANNPNYSGGTPVAFDQRPVPANQKYRFNIDVTRNGNNATAFLVWDWQQQQVNLNDNVKQGVVPQLPHGKHKIKWFVSDNCGNESVCEYIIDVKDAKKPTVVCYKGLSVNIMPTKMVTLWDTDFLKETFDNCTPTDRLITGIRRAGTGTGFPRDPITQQPIKSVTFDCNDKNKDVEVELWSEDLAGNADFCKTFITIQDPNNFCGPIANSAAVAGTLMTDDSKAVEEVSVELTAPGVNHVVMSDDKGLYVFPAVPAAPVDLKITPTKDDNPLNGVSTYDLVLISRHILGLDPLDGPYKMIAADANKSGSITTFDIVELRKLILGIYTELPNNTSWRFVDEAYQFPNKYNPFQTTFPEWKTMMQANGAYPTEDFVAIKVGDVNGSAIANSLVSADDRSAGALLFDAEDRTVKAGEVFTVNFKASDKFLGYQFTMNLNGLEVVDVVPGANMTKDNFGVFANALTASVDEEEAGSFGVTFRATKDGRLSQMVGASSRITRAEAYSTGAERLDVAFRFDGQTIAGVGFELYQNVPNPFISKTMIGFHLPEAAEATLSIFDESGRVIFQQTADYAKGYNTVMIDRSLLNTTGMLYYRLETAKDSATKSMIQTK